MLFGSIILVCRPVKSLLELFFNLYLQMNNILKQKYLGLEALSLTVFMIVFVL